MESTWRQIRPVLILSWILCLGAENASRGWGQEPASTDWIPKFIQQLEQPAENIEDSIFVPPPRDRIRPLLQAARALSRQEFARAVELLSDLVAADESEDYLIPDPRDPSRAVSLRAIADRMLLAIPESGLANYRLRHGAAAEQMLTRAVETQDWRTIARVSQRFFVTSAGWEAGLLLGHEQLQRGNPLAAANCFRKLVEYEPARQVHDPQVSLLLAISWLMAGDERQARATMQRLLSKLPDTLRTQPLPFWDQTLNWPKDDEDSLEWLIEVVGRNPISTNRSVQQWLLSRGNPQRNASSPAGLPLPLPNWSIATNLDPNLDRVVRDRLRELILSGATSIPSLQPLAMGDVAIMRTFDQMWGVDLRSGRRTWSFPADFAGSLSKRSESPAKSLRLEVNSGSYEQRYWLDSVYGQASSAGDLVFVVPQPGFVGDVAQQLVLPGGELIRHPLARRTVNELQALDLAREGSVRWTVGGRDGLDEPALKEAFFLGPPLPLDDRLYAICHQGGVIRLVVLEAASGHLIWTQQLASTNAYQSFLEMDLARLGGAIPSFSEGILVCPTGVGALVAVDIDSQAAIWALRYGDGKATPFLPNGRSRDNLIDGLWRDSTILIDQGIVVCTPMDSQHLLCFDLLSGDRLPPDGMPRNDGLYVACLQAGHMVLVGREKLVSISFAEAGVRWVLELGSKGTPSGRGYYSADRYYLPTTTGRVLEIDLNSGSVRREVVMDRVLGNLICYQGLVLSQGVDHFAAYPQDESCEALIAAATRSRALTPELRALDARLQLARGNLAASLDSACSAAAEDSNPANLEILKRIAAQIARTQPVLAASRIQELPTAVREVLRPDLSAALIDGYLTQSLWESAFGLAWTESREIFESPSEIAGFWLEIPSPNSATAERIRWDCFLTTRLRRLARSAPPEMQSVFRQEIATWFQSQSTQPLSWQWNFVRQIGIGFLPDQDLENLADALILAGESLAADRLLTALIRQGPDSKRAGTRLRLAENLVQHGMYRPALDLLDSISTQSLSELGPDVTARIAALRGLMPPRTPSSWPNGTLELSVDREWQKSAGLPSELDHPLIPISVPAIGQDLPVGTSAYRNGALNELLLLDGNGHVVWRAKSEPELPPEFLPVDEWQDVDAGRYQLSILRIHERIGMLLNGQSVGLLDPYRWSRGSSAIRWQNYVSSSEGLRRNEPLLTDAIWGNQEFRFSGYTSGTQIQTRCWPSPHGLTVIDRNQVVLFDLASGHRLWEFPLHSNRSLLFGDHDAAIILDPDTREVQTIDLTTLMPQAIWKIPPEWGFTWWSYGRSALFISATESQQTLRQVNLVTGREIWVRNFPRNTLGCQIDLQTIGVLEPSGRITLIHTVTGQTLVESRLPVESMSVKEFDRLRVDRQGSAWVLRVQSVSAEEQARFRSDIRRGPSQISLAEAMYPGAIGFGYVFSFDAETGQARWPKPLRLEHFQHFELPFGDLPFAVVARRLDYQHDYDTQYLLQFVVLDLRTGEECGRLLVPHATLEAPLYFAQPGSESWWFAFSSFALRARFSGEPHPPRYARELTLSNTVPAISSGGTRPAEARNSGPDNEAIKAVALEEIRQEQAELERLRQEFEEQVRRRKKPD